MNAKRAGLKGGKNCLISVGVTENILLAAVPCRQYYWKLSMPLWNLEIADLCRFLKNPVRA